MRIHNYVRPLFANGPNVVQDAPPEIRSALWQLFKGRSPARHNEDLVQLHRIGALDVTVAWLQIEVEMPVRGTTFSYRRARFLHAVAIEGQAGRDLGPRGARALFESVYGPDLVGGIRRAQEVFLQLSFPVTPEAVREFLVGTPRPGKPHRRVVAEPSVETTADGTAPSAGPSPAPVSCSDPIAEAFRRPRTSAHATVASTPASSVLRTPDAAPVSAPPPNVVAPRERVPAAAPTVAQCETVPVAPRAARRGADPAPPPTVVHHRPRPAAPPLDRPQAAPAPAPAPEPAPEQGGAAPTSLSALLHGRLSKELSFPDADDPPTLPGPNPEA